MQVARVILMFNGPFQKLSRAMLVTSFGGQIMGGKRVLMDAEDSQRALSRQQRGRRYTNA